MKAAKSWLICNEVLWLADKMMEQGRKNGKGDSKERAKRSKRGTTTRARKGPIENRHLRDSFLLHF